MAVARRNLERELLQSRSDRDRMEAVNSRIRSEREALRKELEAAQATNRMLVSTTDTLTKANETLQIDLKKSQKFGKDLEDSLNDLQTRFEDQDRKCHNLRFDKDDLASTIEAAKRKQALQATDIAKLTNSRANLEQELKAARAALLSSEAPSVAEQEGLNGELRTLRTANANLEKKVASHAHDNEYMRQQYQTASTAAAASANEISDLERKLEVAQRQAQGEATRLAGVSRTEETRQAQAMVELLRLEVASRERLLQKQAEDLKEFKDFKRGRGGVVTRGSSVQAKSPRGGSRAGSPSVGGGGGYGGKVGGSSLRYGSGVRGDEKR